ncbi:MULTISPECIES: YhbY family RNA-binding protein [unclassified Oceanobacter]|uniref:YhbY family RNA-binding protein n=1 Tax=unclassified Oceanobacter TaxID=2620260 RepID=UPI0026E2DED0|nr:MULTISPECIES: YhbY family RNA-binding protein [unclassified Oceanobacter]MDO6681348.1 YhbY family RNA-binding protein [Oceanobacter sp. 5_MG-2023]MDP2548181.1 YhbY family RNA-binding protein [Oceanobacter sp. 4_MG-2023]MDP2608102.1 YhbY family RNA-binding protein [Oceanobacter sp. 1_MG-2023]MDP2611236.1 YhbY family RNA-binding protein [Oceanobacter sp. 2_MG-2023]
MPLTNEQKKAYRAIGHNLNPIVTVASNGLSENVLDELNRALDDHELIKIKISVGDRDLKKEVIAELLKLSKAILVQQIGNTALLLRRNPRAKINLSNLQRGDHKL